MLSRNALVSNPRGMFGSAGCIGTNACDATHYRLELKALWMKRGQGPEEVTGIKLESGEEPIERISGPSAQSAVVSTHCIPRYGTGSIV